MIRSVFWVQYYMLSYAFTTLNQGGYEDVATEEFENIHNLFAAILAKGIGKQLKQGLYREYLNRKHDSSFENLIEKIIFRKLVILTG